MYSCFTLLCQFPMYVKWIGCIYVLLFWISFPCRSHGALSKCPVHTVHSHRLSILYTVVYIRQSQFTHPPLCPLVSYVCSLYPCLSFCFANKIVYTIFPEEGMTTPQHSYLVNPKDREAWEATVHGFAELDRTEATEHRIPFLQIPHVPNSF